MCSSDLVVRQRNRLEEMGVIIREGNASERKLYPWWQWASLRALAGDIRAVEELLLRVINKPVQAKIEFSDDEPKPAPQIGPAPEPNVIAAYISDNYPSLSFFELDEEGKRLYSENWRLSSVADLAWLFDQNITPLAYDRYRRLNPQQRAQLEKHAPKYAWGNRDGADFMMDLSAYLDPREPGYLKRIRDRASRKFNPKNRTGFNASQAAFIYDQSRGNPNDYFK